jgi:hypothetical protein
MKSGFFISGIAEGILKSCHFKIYTKFVKDLNKEKETDEKWKDFSLSQAMSGMESEDKPDYTEADLKERWN